MKIQVVHPCLGVAATGFTRFLLGTLRDSLSVFHCNWKAFSHESHNWLAGFLGADDKSDNLMPRRPAGLGSASERCWDTMVLSNSSPLT